MHNQAQL